VIKAKLGDRLDDWISAALPFLVRHPVNPNLLTMIGTLVSLGSATAFAFGRFGLGAWLILAGGLFDLIDGVVARRHGTATPFGAFLDSTMDRLADMAILLGVMLHFAARGDAGTVLLAGVALIAAVLTSYAKARAEQWVRSFQGGLLERGERLFVLAVGAVSGYLVAALWILAVLGTATVVYRFSLAYRELARLESGSAAGGTAG
jgi:phosphatidylglycerophosphate synthase